ncbi:MAG: BrnT family toxin [Caulobacteraceae bacterium]
MKIEFEWDATKARENRRKHGVTFDQAKRAFRDPLGVEWIDDSRPHGEERTILLAMADGMILVVVFTERGEHIRLISARKATGREQELYYKENSG